MNLSRLLYVAFILCLSYTSNAQTFDECDETEPEIVVMFPAGAVCPSTITVPGIDFVKGENDNCCGLVEGPNTTCVQLTIFLPPELIGSCISVTMDFTGNGTAVDENCTPIAPSGAGTYEIQATTSPISLAYCKNSRLKGDITVSVIPCIDLLSITCPPSEMLDCGEDVPAIPVFDDLADLTQFEALGGSLAFSTCADGATLGADDVLFDVTDVMVGTLCGGGSVERTFTAQYAICNMTECELDGIIEIIECTQSFSFPANMPPTLLVNGGGDVTTDLGCQAAGFAIPAASTAFTITDDCDDPLPVPVVASFGPTGVCQITEGYTYTVTDACGEAVTVTETYTYNLPPPAPAFDAPPGDISIACAAAPPAPSPLTFTNGAIAECLVSGSVTSIITGAHDQCGGSYTETWTIDSATCMCSANGCSWGAAIVHARIITVEPAAEPVITTGLPATLDCAIIDGYVPPDATYTNGEMGACEIAGVLVPIYTYEEFAVCINQVVGELTVVYTIPSLINCNRGDIVSETVIPVMDVTPPTVSCLDFEVALDGNGEIDLAIGLLYRNLMDDCSEEIIVEASQLFFTCDDLMNIGTTDCATDIDVTLTFTDECLNATECIAVVTLKDDMPPTIVCPSDKTINLGPGLCGSLVKEPTPRAFDNCSVSISRVLPSDDFFEINCSVGESDPVLFLYMAEDDCLNTSTCQYTIVYKEYESNSNLSCNDHVNVSANANCNIEFNADMMLEGGPYGCYGCFQVTAEEVHTESALAEFIVTVTDPDTGNSCWGTVTVEDKNDPTVTCIDCTDPDVTDPACIFNCTEEKLFNTFVPEEGRFGFDNRLLDGLIPSDGGDFIDDYVRDNCGGIPIAANYTDKFSPLGNCSEGTLMTRTWTVNYDKVGGGVGTVTCEKYYKFLPIEVFDAAGNFTAQEAPHDTTTITLPDVNGNDYDISFYSPDPVEDAILMPKQVVVIPNCGVGTDPASIAAYYDDSTTIDRDTDDDGTDPDEFDVDCVIESNEGIWYAYPHYYINGISPTGPHAQPISEEVCNLVVQYNDTPLEACAEGCNGNSKLLRTWTILDWCASVHAEYEQIIKVIDDLGPGMELRPIEASVDPWDCKADVPVPAPYSIADNCDADVTYSIGFVEGAYTVTGDAETGYVIHDVPMGTIRIQYVAEDCCGNKGDAYTTITVTDATAPVPVTTKNLVIELSRLGGDPDSQGADQGTAKVHTEDLDNGSYDSCTDVDMHIRRASNDYCIPQDTLWGDFVSFCCADIPDGATSREIQVEMRVCDWNGNCNYIWSTILLEDKSGGAMQCPLDMVLPCTADIWDLDLTGTPRAWTTCAEIELEVDTAAIYDDTEPRNKTRTQGGPSLGQYFGTAVPEYNASCGFGAIRRQIEGCPDQWFVIEPAAPGTVIQNEGEEWVATSGFDSSSISWPENQIVDCDGYEAGVPSYTSAICNLTGPTLRTEEVNIEDGACRSILNHWTIIDWCAYNPSDPDLNNSLEAEDADGDGISNLDDDDDDNNGEKDGVPYDTDGDGIDDTVDPDLFNPKNEDSGFVEGRYDHTQVIKIIDTEAPTVTSVDSLCFGVDTDLCTKKGIVLSATGADNGQCSSAWISWIIHVDIDNDWVVDCTYSSDAPPTIDGEPNPKYVEKSASGAEVSIVIDEDIAASKGNHRVEWIVNDGCGNGTTMTTHFTVEDKKAPTPYCVNLGTAVMAPTADFPDGMVELWAIDFNQNSFDNCSGDETLLYTFTDVPPPPRCDAEFDSNRDLMWYDGSMWFYNSEEIDTDGDNDCDIVGFGEYSNGGFDQNTQTFPAYRDEIHRWLPGLRSSGAIFTREEVDASGFMQIPIYVWDECGSKDFCLVNLRIIDNGGGAMVAGVVKTELDETVEDVQTEIMNSNSGVIRYDMTTETGSYAFDSTALDFDYEISATKNDDYKNGVSTIDLVIAQRHILGLELLDSPYKMIAADINNDKRINGQDLIELRKLILGIYTELPQNDSWKIINAKHAEENLTLANPWDYRESINIADMADDMMGQDFIGAKIGDLDNSAELGFQSGGSSGRVTNLDYEDGLVEAGEAVELTLSTTESLYGYQFTMDMHNMEFVGLAGADVTEGNIGLLGSVMTMSYDNVNGTTGELFTLTLIAKTAGQLSDLIGINSAVTNAEAYVGADLEVVQLTMSDKSAAIFSLGQNEPNPFKDMTTIGYSLPEASDVTLTMYDVTGKVLEVIETSGERGANTVTVQKERLKAGVVYYKLEAGEYTATKHMIVIE